MSELRFRVWAEDDDPPHMIECVCVNWAGKALANMMTDMYHEPGSIIDGPVMVSTGCIDKKDKEIYEKDVVLIWHYRDSPPEAIPVERTTDLRGIGAGELEVIGNEYEGVTDE